MKKVIILVFILIGIFKDEIFLMPPVISNNPLIIEYIKSFVGIICLIKVEIIRKKVITPKSNSSVLKVLKILSESTDPKEELLSILFLCILFIPLIKEEHEE